MRIRIWNLSLLLLVNVSVCAQRPSPERWTLVFEGNRAFSEQTLLDIAEKCLKTDTHLNETPNPDKLDYCLRKTQHFLLSKGYLQAALEEPKKQETEDGLRVSVRINEGPLYRLGEVRIEGSKLFSPAQILEALTLKTGDIADADSLDVWLYERLKRSYSNFGYIQYTAELEPKFHLATPTRQGVVDFTATIDEGKAFTIQSIKFEAKGNVPENVLLEEMLVRIGEVFNKQLFEDSLRRISQTGKFEVIDAEKDVDYKWDQKSPRLDLTIRVKNMTATP